MKKNIVIYQDEGVGELSLKNTTAFFKNNGDDVKTVLAHDVSNECVFQNCDVFVMPGGADVPYCQKLNGAGNSKISAFVEQGGTYLGICAGAYYGCAAIEYHKGREDEILGERELAFIDCVAVGSIPQIAPYYDDTLNSAAIANIALQNDAIIQTYYHGGCYFDVNDHEAKIFGRYDSLPTKPAAIITKKVGLGRVILSGVHLEANNTQFGEFKDANNLLKELIKP